MNEFWIPRLGWALLHFLWQGTAIAAIYALARGFITAVRVRYALACAAMAAMLLAPLFTFLSPAVSPQSAFWTVPAPQTKWLLPAVVVFWLAGVMLFSARLIVALRFATGLRASSQTAPSEWQARLDRMTRHMRPVRLLISGRVTVPTVIGWLRPVILVPVAFLANLPVEHIDALLAHELAHIRRHDYLINLLQSAAEIALFYHPAVWWISGQIRAEREMCCDDLAVASGVDVLTYARALADLESGQTLLVAANGGSLITRIRRLVEPKPADLNRLPSTGIVWAMIGLWIVGAGAASVHGAPPVALGGLQPLPLVSTTAMLFDPLFAVQADAAPPQRPAVAPNQAQPDRWRKWLNEDVAYIITNAERQAFNALTTDEEHAAFAEQFWLRRDPTPETVQNEYKEEHYRRIAYVNEHFPSDIPGWKTDRGRIYIVYGPPDEIDSHPSGGSYQRPASEGGGSTSTYPFEDWRYRHIDGIGNDINIEFVDSTMSGEYHMTMDPSEKDQKTLRTLTPGLPDVAANQLAKLMASPPLRFEGLEATILPMNVAVNYVRATDSSVLTLITVQFPEGSVHANLFGRISSITGQSVSTFERPEAAGMIEAAVPLAPNRYKLNIVAKETAGPKLNSYQMTLDVPDFDEGKLDSRSLILAESIDPLPATGIGGAFAIRGMSVRPNVGNPFPNNGRIGVYLQLYHFGIDDRTRKPAGSVEYRIAKGSSVVADFTEDVAAIPNASPSQVTIEKMMPLAGFDPGSYVLKVIATDRVRNQTVERQQRFSIH